MEGVKPARIWIASVSWVARGQKPQCVVSTSAALTEDHARQSAVNAAKPYIGDRLPKGGLGVVVTELTPAMLEEMLERSSAWYEEHPDE
jgi:hypothetical protein